MFKSLFAITAMACTSYAYSQDSASTSSSLELSGSVDAYYKYDLSGVPNIPTYFDSDQNSISLGMIDVLLKKTTGKASFIGEVSFGPRGQYQSLPNGDGNGVNGGNSFQIQNLNITYAFTDRFSMTAGYMGTFIGYEVISPLANFHYSTSYLFGAGPFQNAGIKANYAISDKVGVMVGLFNDWNVYQDFNGVSHFGAQLSLNPLKGWTAYLNLLTGSSDGGGASYSSGTLFDLTTSYQVSDNFSLGLNAADYTFDAKGGYSGIALYPKYNLSDRFGLGLRAEYFTSKTGDGAQIILGQAEDESVSSLTFSADIKTGALIFIPEVRLDNASQNIFLKRNSSLAPDTKSASQFSLAVIYAF